MERVRAVTFWAGGDSFLRGVAVGAASGLALGTAAALADNNCRGFVCPEPRVYIGVGVAFGGLLGGAIGGLSRTRLDARPAAP